MIQVLLSGDRRIDCVVNVARDDECISLLFDQLVGQPVEKRVMFDAPVETVQFLAKMQSEVWMTRILCLLSWPFPRQTPFYCTLTAGFKNLITQAFETRRSFA